MLSAYDVMDDLWRQHYWPLAQQLQHVLDFIDSRDEAEALLEYLRERIAEEDKE